MTTRFEPAPRSAATALARDPVSRRRFFALGGGTSAAAFLAACGSSDDTTSSTSSTAASTGTDDMASQFGEGDLGIVNYALTLEYLETAVLQRRRESGLFKGDDLALIKTSPTPSSSTSTRSPRRRRSSADAGREAEGRVPAQGRDRGPEAGRDRREPRRRGLPRPGRRTSSARTILAAALVDPLGRGPPRRRAQRRSPARSRPPTAPSPRRRHAEVLDAGPAVPRSRPADRRKEAT